LQPFCIAYHCLFIDANIILFFKKKLRFPIKIAHKKLRFPIKITYKKLRFPIKTTYKKLRFPISATTSHTGRFKTKPG
jgi:hypothetical protein